MIPPFPRSNLNPRPRTIVLLSLSLCLFDCLSLSYSKSPQLFNYSMPRKRNQTALMGTITNTHSSKLRRLPHVFGKVLELPFNSDADVWIEERPDCLRFVAKANRDLGEVRAHVVQLCPGVKKVVIRRSDGCLDLLIDELELDAWRFRLPKTALPDSAKAVYGGGQLVVTVPKTGRSENGVRICNEGLAGGGGNLVLVQ
ncbi:hypothetical protein Nepgr_030329 [Nepenthes gracilis]|uniref:Uncharacterized protein n=1 Tax=Nepenthes gracilis TaxID=150966 RepID=A0AAD3Y6G0_NEPGR|nr:hypothetical protein Nepgr_030329 [Nepenthes gracilis]